MDFFNLIMPILQDTLITLVIAFGGYLTFLLNKKKVQLMAETKNETAQYYIEMIDQTVTDCVAATTQTYVESLKNKNMFDKDAQLEAFSLTYNAILDILSVDALEYINNIFGDIELYLTNKIEASVHWQKEK